MSSTYVKILTSAAAACLMLLLAAPCKAQLPVAADSTALVADTVALDADTAMLAADTAAVPTDIIELAARPRRDWNAWRPNAQRALWLAVVIPGGGQIYNRKYWKLPIVYGGFIGCFYAIRWNNMMYNDYSQAYLDLMDGNLETTSYNKFSRLGKVIDETNASDLQTYSNKFKRRKDYYRRYRDLSTFIMIGVYALSVIDAYVDASLSEFDISSDLSMRLSPAVLPGAAAAKAQSPWHTAALGFTCSLNF